MVLWRAICSDCELTVSAYGILPTKTYAECPRCKRHCMYLRKK